MSDIKIVESTEVFRLKMRDVMEWPCEWIPFKEAQLRATWCKPGFLITRHPLGDWIVYAVPCRIPIATRSRGRAILDRRNGFDIKIPKWVVALFGGILLGLLMGCATPAESPRPWVEDAAQEAYLQGYDRGCQARMRERVGSSIPMGG